MCTVPVLNTLLLGYHEQGCGWSQTNCGPLIGPQRIISLVWPEHAHAAAEI